MKLTCQSRRFLARTLRRFLDPWFESKLFESRVFIENFDMFTKTNWYYKLLHNAWFCYWCDSVVFQLSSQISVDGLSHELAFELALKSVCWRLEVEHFWRWYKMYLFIELSISNLGCLHAGFMIIVRMYIWSTAYVMIAASFCCCCSSYRW